MIHFGWYTSLFFCLLLPKINNKVDNMLMSHTQFCLEEDTLLEQTALVLDALPEIGGHLSPEDREAWIQSYSSIVATAFNKRRGYILERCQVAILDWVKSNGSSADPDDFPTPKDVLRCAKRNIDLSLPEGHDSKKDGDLINCSPDGKLFDWYWNSLLPKTLGNTAWGERMRHYQTITDARHHHYGKYKTQNLIVVPPFCTHV